MDNGNPDCKVCRGSGVKRIHDTPTARKAYGFIKVFPAEVRCGCVSDYQAKLSRQGRKLSLANLQYECGPGLGMQ